MIDPKQLAELDQANKILQDALPPFWRGIYRNCIEQGFTPAESLEILKTYIISQGNGDKKVND